jgi:GTP-binding protein EngB required for normal cell division
MDIEDRVYLVIGESQKGKSSFIKDITGQDVPIGEYGDGKSFTSEINLYKSVKFLKGATFIDTFGA